MLSNFTFTLEDLCETVMAVPANVAIFEVEPDDRFVIRAMSPTLMALYDTTVEIAVGREVDNFKFDERTRRRLKELYIKCRDSGKDVSMDEALSKPDGFRIWTNRTVVPVLDDAGQTVALISTVTDISELVMKRKALVRSLSAMASGYETICAWCRKIKEDKSWITLEQYVEDHSDSNIIVCPDCQNARKQS